jgi:hypothetical protein
MTRWWAPPLLVFVALIAVGADVDLLPVTAVLLGAGLVPLGLSEAAD